MVLPVIAIIILVAVGSLIGTSLIGVLLPAVGNYIWAGVFVILAYLFRNTEAIHTKTVSIPLAGIFGLIALGFISMNLLNIHPTSIVSTLAGSNASALLGGTTPEELSPLALPTLGILFLLTLASVVLLNSLKIIRIRGSGYS